MEGYPAVKPVSGVSRITQPTDLFYNKRKPFTGFVKVEKVRSAQAFGLDSKGGVLAVFTAQNRYLCYKVISLIDQRHDVVTANKPDVPCSIIREEMV